MEPSRAVFESPYRRIERAAPALFLLMTLYTVLVVWLANHTGYDRHMETKLMAATGGFVLAMLWTGLNAMRVHRWSVSPQGLTIEERPRVPLTGLRRRVTLSFNEIAALRRLERGLGRILELETRQGRRHRLAEALAPAPPGLDAFQAALLATAESAGQPLPAPREGLDGLSRWPVILFMSVLFVLSLGLSGGTLWMLFVDPPPVRPRGGEALAIFILLPVGLAWLLRRSLRRRAVVLRGEG